METVNLMALSSVNKDSYDGKSDNDIPGDIYPWGGGEVES